MAQSEEDKYCVFSAMRGFLTLNNQAATNITLVRTVQWQSIETDSTITDQNGFFIFSSLFAKNRKKQQHKQFLAIQNIFAELQNHNVRLWFGSKLYPDEFSESRGSIISVKGEIRSEEKVYSINSQVFMTRFDWSIQVDNPSDLLSNTSPSYNKHKLSL